MEAFRFLTRVRIAIAVGLLGLAAPTVRAEDKPAAMPRWVKISLVSANATEFGAKGVQTAENLERVSILDTAKNVGDLAISARHMIRQNSAIINGRGSSGAARSIAKVGLLTAGWAGYDLTTGQMTVREAGKGATSLAVGAAAGAIAPAAMIAFAGAVGTTSAGVAIGSLSGAAYTSAATAWFGGGALSAGGGGIAAGTTVMTAGTVIVVAAVVVGVGKIWDMADPAERDGVDMFVQGLLKRTDLTDANSEQGKRIIDDSRALENAKRLKDRK